MLCRDNGRKSNCTYFRRTAARRTAARSSRPRPRDLNKFACAERRNRALTEFLRERVRSYLVRSSRLPREKPNPAEVSTTLAKLRVHVTKKLNTETRRLVQTRGVCWRRSTIDPQVPPGYPRIKTSAFGLPRSMFGTYIPSGGLMCNANRGRNHAEFCASTADRRFLRCRLSLVFHR
jgi:hypothetical protein